jgi:hypothetical protein
MGVFGILNVETIFFDAQMQTDSRLERMVSNDKKYVASLVQGYHPCGGRRLFPHISALWVAPDFSVNPTPSRSNSDSCWSREDAVKIQQYANEHVC